jgi:hypothetical protein
MTVVAMTAGSDRNTEEMRRPRLAANTDREIMVMNRARGLLK